ncbi:hypothetical protein BDR07DRAFT_1385116 [Suillus spraguei]|nr:hypothetical protein BDR07DRAFT_1385116 [Suillus spraguei]
MTTLRSTYNLWRSYSMSPYQTYVPSTWFRETDSPLPREIEKVDDSKALYTLLMPWELGCNLVFEHYNSRPDPSKPVTQEEYRDLMDLLRPRVSQFLGASLLSRVITVLPCIPFTAEEKMAVAAEAV